MTHHPEMTQTQLETTIIELGLTMTAEFVPWSKSRNAKPNPKLTDRSLNWKVKLFRPGYGLGGKTAATKEVIETDYQAGIGHCPSYREGPRSVYGIEAIERETETGRQFVEGSTAFRGKPILPKIADVVYALVQDASVIDMPDFESWATSLGYDPDSRSAEKVYQQCLKIALALRNQLGERAFARLSEAAQDY